MTHRDVVLAIQREEDSKLCECGARALYREWNTIGKKYRGYCKPCWTRSHGR